MMHFVCECGRKKMSVDIIEYPEEYKKLSEFCSTNEFSKIYYSIINKDCWEDGEKIIEATDHLFLIKDK